MEDFTYAVLAKDGTLSEGRIQAETKDAAIAAIHAKGQLLLAITAVKKEPPRAPLWGSSVSPWELVFLAEQLATLLEGGVPLMRALTLQKNQTANPELAAVLEQMAQSLSKGNSLAAAVQANPRVFSPFWVAMIRVGESSGNLPTVLFQIAGHLEAEEDLKGRVTTALLYPVVLIGLSLLALAFFVVRIVPTFAEIFASFDVEMPAITKLLVGVSAVAAEHAALIVFVALAAFFSWKVFAATEFGARRVDGALRAMPVFGTFRQWVHMERLLASMTMMLAGGVGIVQAFEVLAEVFAASSPSLRQSLLDARGEITSGKTIAAALAGTGRFPSLVSEMVSMGEESGKLQHILASTRRYYAKRIDQFIRRFTAVIDPILVVAVGGIVVVIVMAIMLPVFSLSRVR